jgi:hypothetical protein
MTMLASMSVGKLWAQETHNLTINTDEEYIESPHIPEEKKHRNFNVAVGESLVLNREENKVIIWGEILRKLHLKGLGDCKFMLEFSIIF